MRSLQFKVCATTLDINWWRSRSVASAKVTATTAILAITWDSNLDDARFPCKVIISESIDWSRRNYSHGFHDAIISILALFFLFNVKVFNNDFIVSIILSTLDSSLLTRWLSLNSIFFEEIFVDFTSTMMNSIDLKSSFLVIEKSIVFDIWLVDIFLFLLFTIQFFENIFFDEICSCSL